MVSIFTNGLLSLKGTAAERKYQNWLACNQGIHAKQHIPEKRTVIKCSTLEETIEGLCKTSFMPLQLELEPSFPFIGSPFNVLAHLKLGKNVQ